MNIKATNMKTRLLRVLLVVTVLCAGVNFAQAFYDPGAQRWINRDPIGEEGGLNLYGFVAGDPVHGIDVYGLFDVDVHTPLYINEDCFWTSSWWPWSYWRHFRKNMDKIEKELQEAISKKPCNWKRFQSRIHQGQDHIGHRKYLDHPWPIGHWVDSKILCPSKCPDKHPEPQAVADAKAFQDKWEKAWKAAGCGPLDPPRRRLPPLPPQKGAELLLWV
jgi:hypothetical protein